MLELFLPPTSLFNVYKEKQYSRSSKVGIKAQFTLVTCSPVPSYCECLVHTKYHNVHNNHNILRHPEGSSNKSGKDLTIFEKKMA